MGETTYTLEWVDYVPVHDATDKTKVIGLLGKVRVTKGDETFDVQAIMTVKDDENPSMRDHLKHWAFVSAREMAAEKYPGAVEVQK